MKNAILFLMLSASMLFFACEKEGIQSSDLVFPVEASGCADFLVYKYSENHKIGLLVGGQSDSLALEEGVPKTFQLPTDELLSVRLEAFEDELFNFYCDDVVEENEKVSNTYEAASGTVTIEIIGGSIDTSGFFKFYDLNVQLQDVTFQDAEGNELFLENQLFQEVTVGWFPG